MPFPQLLPLGLGGVLVRFGDTASETANRAALAFRAALAADPPPGMTEAATTLASVAVLFDPLAMPPAAMGDALRRRLDAADWFAAPLPEGRRLWRIPAAFGGAEGPGLAGIAEAAGMSPEDAVEAIRPHIARHLAAGGRIHDVTRHMLGLFAGRPGARGWRRCLSEGGTRPGARLELLDAALAELHPLRAAG